MRKRRGTKLNAYQLGNVPQRFFYFFFSRRCQRNVFVGTRGVSIQFDVHDVSPPLASARGMALVSVGLPFLAGSHARIAIETED